MPKQPSAAEINRVVRKIRKWPEYAGRTEEELRVTAEGAVQLGRALACGEVLHRAPTPEELQEFAANRAELEHREYREYQEVLSKDLAREREEEALSEDEWKQKRERERQVEKENELLENQVRPQMLDREAVEGVLQATKREMAAGPEGARLMRVAERRWKRLARAATGGKRGRPRLEQTPEKQKEAFEIAREKHIEGLTWEQIACRRGMKPTKANIRTLTRKVSEFAEMVFNRLRRAGVGERGEGMDETLAWRLIRDAMLDDLGFRFDRDEAACIRLAKILFPIGRKQRRFLRRMAAIKLPDKGK